MWDLPFEAGEELQIIKPTDVIDFVTYNECLLVNTARPWVGMKLRDVTQMDNPKWRE